MLLFFRKIREDLVGNNQISKYIKYAVLPKIADYVRINPPEILDLDSLYGYRFHNDIEILIYIMKEKNQVYSDVRENISDLSVRFQGFPICLHASV